MRLIFDNILTFRSILSIYHRFPPTRGPTAVLVDEEGERPIEDLSFPSPVSPLVALKAISRLLRL